MGLFPRKFILAALAGAAILITQSTGYSGAGQKISTYGCRIVNVYPHDPAAFTQGLVFDNGFLYEGTGQYGESTVRKVELETGRVLLHQCLPDRHFGEGITIMGNRLIQLTWRSGTGFIYDKKSLKQTGVFQYGTEGWGITNNGKHLIMSDGTSMLRFLDPRSFEIVRTIEVREGPQAVSQLNELEYIKGFIYANIWGSDRIAKISPKTGQVAAWIDLSGLRGSIRSSPHAEVLNGIAYDSKHDRIFVTGKYWPKVFEIRFIRK
ncbi:MAG: glutaminyl-peptide cyclotransferase [Syntrophales bacterium]